MKSVLFDKDHLPGKGAPANLNCIGIV